jgi:hypothetical protein
MNAALWVLGCFLAASDHTPARDVGQAAAPVKASERSCPTEKIRFTRETGCRNDGYVEFCLPARDKKLRAAVERIAPTAENKGPQRCEAKTELLFFLPVDVETGSCVERWGAMTARAWNQVCALARLPQIQSIRHTIFE